MYAVMENNSDVVIVIQSEVTYHQSVGFKVVGARKTIKGAERLAGKRCEL